MKRVISIALALLLTFSALGVSWAEQGAESALPPIDMSAWRYDAEDGMFWQTGLSYAASPADAERQTMGIFVPEAYFDATDNGDGTWSCTVNPEGAVSGYTARTAPLILPVNTPGYAAMAAPVDADSSMGYGSVSDYTDAGMIVLFAGARGRDAGAPAGVTDFKAAIRYARYNADRLPGDMDSIFSLGMSGGGAQSAIIGASGDSALYEPYLEAIGAVQGVSDAVKGSMCWCPITNLDLADEAYEWNLGNTRTGLSEQEQALSDGMAEAFAEAVNGLGLTDEAGNALTLTESQEGIFQAGSYYDYLLNVVETSLNHFLEDTAFPYTASAGMSGRMGGFGDRELPAGGRDGGRTKGAGDGQPPEGAPEGPGGERMPEGAPEDGRENAGVDFAAIDDIDRSRTETAGVTISGVYETAQDYVDALNANAEWVHYDADTNTASITSLADFTAALKVASKGIAAFDQLDGGQGENTLFGYGEGGAHFDPILAELVASSEYADSFAEDLSRQDAQGNTVDVRVAMYNPMYYLCSAYEGYQTASVARYWRIRSGINQSDTALCTEVNLALAARSYSADTAVDFETVWGQGHVTAERTGDAVENFIEWVNACMAD